jgi:hypothetical protein
MWPSRVENPIFLLNIYGHYPSLADVEVTSLRLIRDGPSLKLSFISEALPYRPQVKWGKFNAVGFELNFFDLKAINIDHMASHGLSTIEMKDGHGAISMTCRGALRCSLTCGFLFVDRIAGLLQSDEDDRS